MKPLILLVALTTLGASCKTKHFTTKETCVYSEDDKIFGCDDPRLDEDERQYARYPQEKDVLTNIDDYLKSREEVLRLINIVESQSNCK